MKCAAGCTSGVHCYPLRYSHTSDVQYWFDCRFRGAQNTKLRREEIGGGDCFVVPALQIFWSHRWRPFRLRLHFSTWAHASAAALHSPMMHISILELQRHREGLQAGGISQGDHVIAAGNRAPEAPQIAVSFHHCTPSSEQRLLPQQIC